MWPAGRPLLEEAPCSADFTEAIDRGMRVPQRLRAAEDSGAGGPAERMLEDFCPSLQMHVPDRLLLAEMPDAALRPLLGNQLRQPWPDVSEPPLEPAAQTAVYGAHPFLSFVPCSGSHRSNQLPELRVGAQKEGVLLESTQLATGRVRQRQGWLGPSVPLAGWSRAGPPPQFPPFPSEGRIYSPQNVLRALRLLGHQLCQLLWKPGPARLR
ncbi:uncharacterized protein LOC123034909 isoform X3 [Varanus komodoensis]|uniref:uncharacterized protein LOC123034909 isoform X3 n=1 Tax=Varanus komodoensis TaxID=61221 RepID=UPI001CF7B0AB|nr:uncharacterized protein LOC123034909 isoform X3 [Varanus komodoensis]